MKKGELYSHVLAWFAKYNPDAATELIYRNPYELLVAVILSAQCTDKRVNMTTPALFKRFPTAIELSEAAPEVVYGYIKSITYPNNKANHLVKCAKALVEKFGGKVPSSVGELTTLPGVGRKTAHVIASVVFNQPKMAVDTHVHRVAARIGLTTGAKTPLQTELQLVKFIPKQQIALAHHWLILHGRYICTARNPKCLECGLKRWCKYYNSKFKAKTLQKVELQNKNSRND